MSSILQYIPEVPIYNSNWPTMTTIRESIPSSSTVLGPLPEDHLVPVKDLTKIFPDI